MSRILVYKTIDIFNQSNYDTMASTFAKKYKGFCPNFGNKLWYQGLISEISTEDNDIFYYNSTITVAEINSNYDMVIYPMANIFSKEFSVGLPELTETIKRIKIPVYIISCGVQADSYDDLDEVVSAIGNVSKIFIKTVYNTGGDFALRGYFTAEFFKKLGFNDLNVVGCPSLFQLGEGLSIDKRTKEESGFKIAVNGKSEIAGPVLKEYKALYYDQDNLFDIMYNSNLYNYKYSIKDNIRWLNSSGFGLYLTDLILQNRIRLIADMWDWQHSLQSEGISFSFGTRIHGNIMAILSGIPSVIVNVDSRVQEMAEFYNIPNIDYKDARELVNQQNAIYTLYDKTDYSEFNKSFPEKYNGFKEFLNRCGIVKKLIPNNMFLNCSKGVYPKCATPKAIERAKRINKHKVFYSFLVDIK